MTNLEIFALVYSALASHGAITLAALNLVVTVIAWTIMSNHQRELRRQQEESGGLTRLPPRSTPRADQFRRLATWISDSEKLRRLALGLQYLPATKDELVSEFREWETAYFAEILPSAEFLDKDLANSARKYYGYMDLFTMHSLNGRPEGQASPPWTTEMTGAKEALIVKLTELVRASVEQQA